MDSLTEDQIHILPELEKEFYDIVNDIVTKNKIETIGTTNEPLFLAEDVIKSLNHINTRGFFQKQLLQLEPSMKTLVDNNLYINEPGFYLLLSNGVEFKNIIYKTILPNLRKYSYIQNLSCEERLSSLENKIKNVVAENKDFKKINAAIISKLKRVEENQTKPICTIL